MVMVCTQVVIGIVGHPDRWPSIERLWDQVEADVMCVDNDGVGCGQNHIATLERAYRYALNAKRDWVAILEDDAVPVENFRTNVELCLYYAPSQIVSLYLGTGYPQQYQGMFAEAVAQDTCWITHKWMRHAVAYCLHVDLIPDLLEQMQNLVDKRWAPDDAIGEFSRQRNIPVAYTNPSLVDHEDAKSVVTQRTHRGHPTFGRNKVRKAHKFGVPDLWNDKYVSV